MKSTIIVNLFGGPGTGKSTGAAYIFSKLKMLGIDAEYVSEFAKDKVWEECNTVFQNQFYITGKQVHRMKRVFGKVDVIVTDAPICLGNIYCPADRPLLKQAIMEEFNSYGDANFNVFLSRVKPYNPNGRSQSENEAKELDGAIRQMLEENNIPFINATGTLSGYDTIVNHIKELYVIRLNSK